MPDTLSLSVRWSRCHEKPLDMQNPEVQMAGTSGIFARPCRLSPSSQALSTEGVCDRGTSPRDQSDGQAELSP